MQTNYGDIKKRIPEPPVWYDSNGTPRYDEFYPDLCPDIYSNTVVLLRIACQSCAMEFDVEMHRGYFQRMSLPSKLHYGDPPIHNCVGDTMNCEDLEVLQVWSREPVADWKRLHLMEGLIDEEV